MRYVMVKGQDALSHTALPWLDSSPLLVFGILLFLRFFFEIALSAVDGKSVLA